MRAYFRPVTLVTQSPCLPARRLLPSAAPGNLIGKRHVHVLVTKPRRITQTASHWGVYRVVTDPDTGDILSSTGVPFDPHPSPLQAGLPETVRDRMRIDRPYVREGYLRCVGGMRDRRGAESFVAVSWDRALDLVCEALLSARERSGN